MMYPTAMATAPLNSNYQNVNMGHYQQHQHQPLADEVSGGAARATITRNGIGNNISRSGAKAHGKNKNNGGGKNHKTKTRPQNRQRRGAEFEAKGWRYESVPEQMDRRIEDNWHAEVPQLSVSRRHSSRGSRLNRLINKTNLGGAGNYNEEDNGVAISATEGEDKGEDVEGDDNEEMDIDSDNEDVNESGPTRSSRSSSSSRSTIDVNSSSKNEGVSGLSTIKPPATAKNPITTTTRRMNVNNDNNSEDDNDGGGDEEEEEEEATAAASPELNGLPKYSFLRGDNFNNRDPAMQYDSAIINNNNGNMNRDGSGEVGVASASTTPTAMELECVAGYDGGLPQYFVLEAYDSRTRKLRLNITSAFPDLPVFRIDMEGTYQSLAGLFFLNIGW